MPAVATGGRGGVGCVESGRTPRAAIWSSVDGRTWRRARGTKDDETFDIGGYIDTMEDPPSGSVTAFALHPGTGGGSGSLANGVVADRLLDGVKGLGVHRDLGGELAQLRLVGRGHRCERIEGSEDEAALPPRRGRRTGRGWMTDGVEHFAEGLTLGLAMRAPVGRVGEQLVRGLLAGAHDPNNAIAAGMSRQ